MVLFLGFCLAVCICYGIGLEYSKWIADSEKFYVQNIEIQGNVYFSQEEILQQCGIKKDESIWKQDLKTMNENLKKIPFFDKVHIYRYFPDKVIISVEEKRPVALLKVNGAFLTVDKEGLVLPSKIGKMYDLPLISGDFKGKVGVGCKAGGKRLQFSLNLLNMIIEQRPKLYSEISEVMVKDGDMVWFFTARYGIPVKAGKGQWMYKIHCFTEVLETLSRKNELDKVEYIDLRYRNQIIVGKRT